MIRSSAIFVAAALLATACTQKKVETEAVVTAETNSPAPAEVIAMEDPDPDTDPGDAMAADEEPADEMPAAGAVSDEERMEALASIGLDHDPEGDVMNDCGEAVTPDVYPVELGGDIGRALLVVMKGGPTTAACYGDTGMQFFLLKRDGDDFKTVASDRGHFAPLDTEHKGVKDFAVGGPGAEFPVYEWTGKAFITTRTISDAEFPASVN